jgi:hypothetical protein
MNLKPTYKELWSLIAGLDEDFHDWQAVRRLKVVARTLEQEQRQEVKA